MHQILIVDDDRVLRKRLIKAIMRLSSDVEVHEVGNAKDAIHHLEKHQADLVITDIRMPGMSGLMVIAFMNAFLPDVPCFVITAYGTSRMREKMPPDLLQFYQKPIDVEAVAITALATVNRKRKEITRRGIQLPNFISLAASDRATATIIVTHEEHNPARLYLREGELIDAVMDYDRGDTAAITALSWVSPGYSIEFGIPDDVEETVRMPLDRMLRIVCDYFDEDFKRKALSQ
jgi:YesN/AraC family two-component response regulator